MRFSLSESYQRIPHFFLILYLITGSLIGCRENHNKVTRESWQYPVRPGDNRARVHELLGNPARATAGLEEYPSSGVTAWFNTEGRVAKLNFSGEAAVLYSTDSFGMIPSKNQVLSGLSNRSDETDFRRILGTPAKEQQERASISRELHCLWKTDSLLINALFLVAPRTHEGKTYGKGSLLWFEVSRSL